jgi:putative amide transporter protein
VAVSNVGLIYVGAVLCVNGLVLLGIVSARSAAVLNFLVGTLQVVLPTVLLAQSGGDRAAILAASGIYLFGFTYLWLGCNTVFGLPQQGFGWFSLYVACCAVAFGAVTLASDPLMGAIWWVWAVLWLLFFLIDARNRTGLRPATGWFAIFCGVATAAAPAFLLLTGTYFSTPAAALGIGAAAAAVLLGGLLAGKRTGSGGPEDTSAAVSPPVSTTVDAPAVP